jgi:hypothetical protein
MHYRNGREAKNGDTVVLFGSGTSRPIAVGTLQNATTGNDYCNGQIVVTGTDSAYGTAVVVGACLCDCLHAEDVASIMSEKGLGCRPAGK